MKKFRQNKTFEQELAGKADEFQMQPSPGLWDKIDNALVPTPSATILPGKTIAFSTLALILLLSAGVYIFSDKTEVTDTFVATGSEMSAPAKEGISKESNTAPILKSEKISPATSTDLTFIPKEFTQTAITSETEPVQNSPVDIITESEVENTVTPEAALIAEEAPAEQTPLPEEIEEAKTVSQAEEVKKEQKTSVKPNRKRIDVDMNFTGGYGGRMLEAKNELARPVLEHRNRHDEGTPAYNARIAIKYYVNNGFALSIGLGYNQWGEKISLSKKPVSPYYDSTARANGYKPEELYSMGTDREFTNKYRQLELPVMIHFEKIHRNKWRLRSALGITFNTTVGKTYKLYDYAVDHFVCEPESIRGFNVNLQGNITVAYQLNERINIYLGPEARYSFFSIYKDSYSIRQNQYAGGLTLGIQYKLRPVFREQSNPLKNR